MSHFSAPRRKPIAVMALPTMLLACVGLAACGGSSSSTSNTVANAAVTSTPAAGAATTGTGTAGTATTGPPAATGSTPAGTSGSTPPSGVGRFAAVRACLQKNGVTLPPRAAGGGVPHRGGPGGLLGGGGASGSPQLPKGMTSAQYQEVLKKCGGGFRGGNLGGARASGARRAFDSQRFRQALTSFAACLRQNGINIPAPNTSGKGPIFSTNGIDTSSPQFKKAQVKCRAALVAGLRTGSSGSAAAGG